MIIIAVVHPLCTNRFPLLALTHTKSPHTGILSSHTHPHTHTHTHPAKLAMRNLRRLTNTLQYRQLTSSNQTAGTVRYPTNTAPVAHLRRLSRSQDPASFGPRIRPIHIRGPNCQRICCGSYASLGKMQDTPSQAARSPDPLTSFERDFSDLPPFQVSTLSKSSWPPPELQVYLS